MSAAVDTNVVLRVVLRDDERQADRALARLAVPGWVSHIVLCEMMWVLDGSYGYERNTLALVLERLLSNEVFVIEEPLVVRSALERFRQHPNVGFSDCLIVETARARGHSPLLTFDRALSKVDGASAL